MKISLLENSHSFLKEALDKAVFSEKDPIQWKFAVFNLVQSIELSLKEKLRREHPALIYSDIDRLRNTVSIDQAINRLSKISKLYFSRSDIKTLTSAKKWRNLIVHYEFEINPKELKPLFAKLLGFLSYFHRKHLDDTLDNIVPTALWEKAIEIFEYSSELYERAKKLFNEEEIDSDLIWACEKCGWDAFVIQDIINTRYVCGWWANVIECPDCRENFFEDDCKELQTGDEQYELFCNDCYDRRENERLDEEYYQYMMDMQEPIVPFKS